MLPERALSLCWPWPHFMFSIPDQLLKRFENRKPGFSHKSFRGDCWVHVTPCKTNLHFESALAFARLHNVPESLMPTRQSELVGSIAGRWTITDLLPPPMLCQLPDRWRMAGQIAFAVENARLVKPVPCKGALGFWRVPADVLLKLAEAP